MIQEEKDADEFQYNGQKRAFLTLKDVRKGDQIDIAYSVVGFNPVFNNRYSDEFSFSMPTAICNYYKTIITTANRPLHIQTINKAPEPTQQHQGDKLIYTWENATLNTDEPLSDAPSWYNPAPTVYVTEYASWKEVVDWGLNTFDHYHHPLPANLQQKIAEWQNRSKGDKDIFAALAIRFVQDEVRYLGLEIGANTHRPHPPGDVFTQRFGDCKDKALLLSTILQQDSIPAYAALISTDTRSRLATVAPSPEEFDHVIVAIRQQSGAYTFIDPTMSGQRGRLADLYVPAYGYSLVLREGETALQPVTPGKINDYSITETLEARYYDTSHFSVISIYSGGAADAIRNYFAETSQKDLEQNYHKIYGTLFEDIRQEGRISYAEDSNKNTVTVTKHYAVPQLWNTNKNGKRYFEYTVKILEQNFTDPADAPANAPISLTYPFNVHYTLDLALPEDWDVADEELHIHNDSYQFDYVPETHGSNMTLHFTFKTLRDNIPAAEIRQYKADYKKISEKFSFQLYKNISSDGPGREEAAPAKSPLMPQISFTACWPAIWLTFFFCLLFSRLFQYLNTRSEETLYSPGSGYPLGGWIALLGISIGAYFLLELYFLFTSAYYNNDLWTAYGKAGGKLAQYLSLSELAIRLTFIAGAGALLFWFFRKRDIFPRMFLWYTAILISGRLLLLALSYTTPSTKDFIVYRPGMIAALVGTALYSAIWISYILRSGQVKSTFLEPFRERIR